MRFCLCIFESDTVKNDCPVQILRKRDLIQTVGLPITSFTISGDIIKKKKLKKKKKKSSENDQLTGHFQSFFILFFFIRTTINLKKNSRKSTNKKILALSKKNTQQILFNRHPAKEMFTSAAYNVYCIFKCISQASR